MRLAGTWSMYSKKAIPQLIRAATIQGLWLSSLRWAYQAKVMKILLKQSRETESSMERMVFMCV
jgi:hypothetical protein